MADLESIESRRVSEQERLDSLKTTEERNKWGQFATPPALATDILQFAWSLWSNGTDVRFLDPAIGTGCFYSALLRVFPPNYVRGAHGIELDPLFADAARSLWAASRLNVTTADFTRLGLAPNHPKYNLVVCNPPYVRHHHITPEHKAVLKRAVLEQLGMRVSGLAGLYSSFLLLCDRWLEAGALSIWLIPSEFMDVNYGEAVRKYLTTRVQLLRIHRFCPSDVQFSDALVSSAIVVFRKARPNPGGIAEMSFGGPLLQPAQSGHVTVETLKGARKWSGFPSAQPYNRNDPNRVCLGDLFTIKRGLATGSNRFFVMTVEQSEKAGIPKAFRRPILPGPRFVHENIIESDEQGYPLIAPRLILVDCSLDEGTIQRRYPRFWRYLQAGKDAGIHDTYLAGKRRPWYSQEKRPPAPFVFTYMGRTRKGRNPFRVIWNKSDATAHNVYLLLYPKADLGHALQRDPSLYKVLFEYLRSIEADAFLQQGRVYGGGLHKMEPREMERVPVQNLANLLAPFGVYKRQVQMQFDIAMP